VVKKYAYIDALRGYAILGVIAIHSAFEFRVFDFYFQQGFRDGQYGVHLFFIASALTLFLSLAGRSNIEKRPYQNFFLRRFFRIAPLFWFAIIAYYLLSLSPWESIRWDRGSELTIWNYILTFSFLHGWSPATINKVVPGDWSIATEMTFYLFVPLLFIYVKKLSVAMWVTVIAILVSVGFDVFLAKNYSVIFPGYTESRWDYAKYNFVRQIPVFSMGMVLYFLISQYSLGVRLSRNGYSHVILVGVFLILLILPYNDNRYIPDSIFYGAVFVVFALILSADNNKLLVNSAICYLGKISFSSYIIHFMVIDVLVFYAPFYFLEGSGKLLVTLSVLLFCVCVVFITAIISSVTYRFIEKPGVRLGNVVVMVNEGRMRPKFS